MKSKLIHEREGERTFALIFSTGDEAMAGLLDFVRRERIGAARFTAIGAFREATVGYFDWEKKEYRKIPVAEQVEVLSMIGDVAEKDGARPCMRTSCWADPTERRGAVIFLKAVSGRRSN